MNRDISKTVESVEKYSMKDSLTWKKMFDEYLSKKISTFRS